MSGRMSRNKGKRGEREIVNRLQIELDAVCDHCYVERVVLQRNLMQADRGGHDLYGLEWLSLEVKRQERAAVGTWWSQCVAQAAKWQTPVLVWRANRQPWRVRMRVGMKAGANLVTGTVDTDFETFVVYFRERCRYEFTKGAVT